MPTDSISPTRRGRPARGLLVQRVDEVPAALAEARAAARGGTPVRVNVWLDKTAFREGSMSM